jgi:hypothetical protein
MNTIWLKLAGGVVAIIVVLVVVGQFTGGKSSSGPAPEPQKDKTFYDMADRDKQFGKEPKPVQQETPQPPPVAPPTTPGPNAVTAPAVQPVQPAPQPARKYMLPSDITQKTTMYFKPMDEDDDIAAQQLLPWATTARSLGRLPFVQYGPMVKASRDILSRWPDSWYAFRAKQMLNEISERYAENYKITEQEMDISRFLKQRPGTEAREVEPVR